MIIFSKKDCKCTLIDIKENQYYLIPNKELQMEKDRLLTIENLADYLQVNKKTIYRWIENGAIPCYKMHHQWRFKKENIENWLEEKKHDHGESLAG